MKYLFASIITIILPVTTMIASEGAIWHARREINMIDMSLDCYEFEGVEFQYDFNYHMGYLYGQRNAYLDVYYYLKHE